eukprot:TRINITY_DN37965_c0_g1_i1.p1 TRINITY_DN37965_c0_g1~~TRINITY_DN37965_c0_g1_i1.p1  ORF type:complete len:424 (+),score=100.70 TRINITY_DN37965_c0_g1_i1:166-1272(+)
MADKEKQLIVSEVNILRSFKHPYIVRYYDRIIDRASYKIYIVMEHCGQGDLASLIRRNKLAGAQPEERHVWRVALQLCLALEACHGRKEGKVLHRDIKPANILLDSDNNVKLGDFGLAKMMGDQSLFARSHVGTPYYMSPEQIKDQEYDERSDVWGLGCVLYEYCQNRPPFEATNHLSLAVKIKGGKFRDIDECYSAELSNFIALCLRVDAAVRPTVEKLLALPCLSIRLKEKKLSNHYFELKRKEEELRGKEAWLNEREAEMARRESELRVLRQMLDDREQLLEEREANLYSAATPQPALHVHPTTPDRDYVVTPPSKGSASSGKQYSANSTPSSLPSFCTPPQTTRQRGHPHTRRTTRSDSITLVP